MIFDKFKVEYKALTDNFSCGNIIIDNFLKSNDALDENQGITYVMLSDKKDFIIGYYNIETGRVDQIVFRQVFFPKIGKKYSQF